LELLWDTWGPNYSRKKFSTRLAALRKMVDDKIQPHGFREPQRWDNSVAYRLLEQDIRNGLVQDNVDFETVYLMRPEYATFDHRKFKKSLNHSGKALENC
jgi:hypothetical protein